MSDHSRKEIPVANLLLSTVNPRFDVVDSQEDAIKSMLKGKRIKVLKLAQDIAEFGLNPAEQSIVLAKDSGKFEVLEGNRRLTALKLLDNPKLAAVHSEDLVEKFEKLKNTYGRKFGKIPCVIFEDREKALRWIKLKHTGQNDGIGTVTWDPHQITQFEERSSGKTSVILALLDFIRKSEHASGEVLKNLEVLPFTNFERLITDSNIQALLGITIKGNKFSLEASESEVIKGLSKVVNDLGTKRIKVKHIYNKSDRAHYIESFKRTEVPRKNPKPESEEVVVDSPKNRREQSRERESQREPADPNDRGEIFGKDSNDESAGAGKKNEGKLAASAVRSRRQSSFRKTIIPKDCILKINSPRINSIYRELKYLDCDDYVNGAAVLLRVFIELSADEFIGKANIPNVNSDSRLVKKIETIAAFLEQKAILDKYQLKGIRTSVSNEHSILSTNTFNAYVHNRHMAPIAKDLKIAWDNIQNFLEMLWEFIEKL